MTLSAGLPSTNCTYYPKPRFLDGEVALEIYKKCEKNNVTLKAALPIPRVFLTGQKKRVLKYSGRPLKNNQIGIAVNKLSNLEKVEKIALSIINTTNYIVRIRWHPRQSGFDMARYRNFSKSHKNIIIAPPKEETIYEFFSHLTKRVMTKRVKSIIVETCTGIIAKAIMIDLTRLSRYSHGRSSSTRLARLRYGGNRLLAKRTP